MLKSKENVIAEIEQCIPSILSLLGLKRTRDYTLSKGQLYLKNVDMKNKVVTALRNFCPDKHYYWETPRLLRWF